ncbi:hypothetical protein Emag_000469 [Eimeria magna]
MPLLTAPASEIAQNIAAKQRSSQIFDSSATMRRPSACAADQQTQLFARNLRTQVPRSPSLSRGNSSTSIVHPTQGVQRNYMRTTSSSRRRSRNPPHEVAEESEPSHPQLSRQLNRSGSSSRMRSQSPYPNSLISFPAASSNSAYRKAPLRQQPPPLPRGRAPSASSRGPRVEPFGGPPQRARSRQPREGISTVAHVAASWQAEASTSYTEQRHQHAQQKLDSLSSSWVVRDPLTAASNENVGFVEGADSGLLQLDVSDQRELAHLTASFEQAGALRLPSSMQYQGGIHQGGSTEMQFASGCAANNTVHQTNALRPPPRPESAYTSETAPRFSSIFDGTVGGPSMPLSHPYANNALRVSATNDQQQQQCYQLGPVSIQQRDAFAATPAAAGRYPISSVAPGNGWGESLRSGVLGRFMPAPEKSRRPSLFERLLNFACWCGRFALVLIVCIWRLLNTSYDSWSARQFTESFSALLASGGVLGLQPLRSSSTIDQWSLQAHDSKPSETQRTPPAPRLSAASLARIAQRQQQEKQQQQQPAVKQQGSQKTLAVQQSCTGKTISRGMNASEPLIGDLDPFKSAHTPEVKPDKAFSLFKVVALLSLGLCACSWLLSLAPREELIDFDLM